MAVDNCCRSFGEAAGAEGPRARKLGHPQSGNVNIRAWAWPVIIDSSGVQVRFGEVGPPNGLSPRFRPGN